MVNGTSKCMRLLPYLVVILRTDVIVHMFIPQALACFQSSCRLGPLLYEPQYNIATSWGKVSIGLTKFHFPRVHQTNMKLNFAMQVGNLQNSYNAVQKSLEAFPGHTDSKELMKQLEQHFAAL